MLLGKLKRIIIALVLVFFTTTVFAATTDLAVRFLNKANEAYEDGNIEDAYLQPRVELAGSGIASARPGRICDYASHTEPRP